MYRLCGNDFWGGYCGNQSGGDGLPCRLGVRLILSTHNSYLSLGTSYVETSICCGADFSDELGSGGMSVLKV